MHWSGHDSILLIYFSLGHFADPSYREHTSPSYPTMTEQTLPTTIDTDMDCLLDELLNGFQGEDATEDAEADNCDYAVVDAATATEAQKQEADAAAATTAEAAKRVKLAVEACNKTADAAAKFAKSRRVQYMLAADQQAGLEECADAEDDGSVESLDWDDILGDEEPTKETINATAEPKLDHSQYKTYKTKKALILAMINNPQWIIIQASHGIIC